MTVIIIAKILANIITTTTTIITTTATATATATTTLNGSSLMTNETLEPRQQTPADCLVLPAQADFLPWDNPENVLSAQAEAQVRKLKDLLFLPLCFLIGCPANALNMAVFYRQGLKERINVCLFALALSDGLYLLCNALWYGEQLYFEFFTSEDVYYGPVMTWLTNHYLLGFYSFTTVSQILSALIAGERCFCVLRPLRSQSVLRTSTTTVIVVVVFVVVVGLYFLVVTRYYIVCTYDPLSASVTWLSLGGEFYYKNRTWIDVLDLFVYGTGLPWVVVLVVMTTTSVTVVKLRQVMEWRKGTMIHSGGRGDGGGLSAREVALTRMLVGSSVFFIVCVFPFTVFRLVTMAVPEIAPGRRHHNLFMTGLWFLNIFSYFNATFNFVIYAAMGSRYRQTVRALLPGRGVGTPINGRKTTASTSAQ